MANHVTISTVGLGQDVNRAFLEKVARPAQGKSYFLNDPAGPGADPAARRGGAHRLHRGGEIDYAEGLEAGAGSGRRGHGERARVAGLRALPGASHGRRYAWRPTRRSAAGALAIRPGPRAVFTSDAKNRWAANWVAWPGFDKLVDQHLPRPSAARAGKRNHRRFRPRQQRTGGGLSPGAAACRTRPRFPDIYALGPNGFQAPLKVDKVAAGHYRGRLAIGQNQGLFRVRPVADSRAFPEVGFYRQEDEMTGIRQ